MKETYKPQKSKIIDEATVAQMKFDAHDKKTLKEAEKAEDILLIQEEIKKCKEKITEIDKDRTAGKLSIRYGISSDYETLASKEVQELEDRIHELENSLKPKKRALRKPKLTDDKEEPVLEPEQPEEPTESKESELPKIDPPPLPEIDEHKTPPHIEKSKRKLGVVDTDLMEKRARDIASERMTADKANLKGVSGFFKKIWKHNWGAEYYRSKETDKIKKELMGAGSAFSETDTSGAIDKRIKESILKRFLEDGVELIHTDAGEWKDTVSIEKRTQAEAAIQDAIKRYASTPDQAQAELDFKAERDRIYSGLFAEKDGSFNPLNMADNVFEFAKEIRAQVEHGKALSELDLDFELTVGEAKSGVRTEAHYNWIEKKTQQLSSTWVGRFFNETTIAAGVSAAMILTKIGTGKGSRAVMGLAGGVVVAGLVSGVRESQAMERDRTEHARSMASGRAFNPTSAPRRKELQEAMYEMINAKTSTEDLHNLLYENVGGVEKERALTAGDVDQILSRLSHIDSRIALSDKGKVDLISYNDEALVEVERTELDFERANAKKILKDAFVKNPTLGNFDTRLQTLISARENEIKNGTGGMEERDDTFKKIKRKHVVRAMATGAITGLTFGLVAQEGASLINGQDGLVEGMRGTGEGKALTSLEWAREKIMGVFGSEQLAGAQGVETVLPGKEVVSAALVGGVAHDVHNTVNSFITLPKGYELNPSGSHAGVYSVFHDGKSVVSNIEIDPKTGGLTQGSFAELDKAGFHINSSANNVTSSITSEVGGTKSVNVQDFANEHSEKLAKIKRLGWADNGTVRPDKNELKLWDPVEKNGHYEYTVKMNSGGSTFNGQHIDPVKLASEGKLKALFSLSHDTQGHPVEVPIKYEGGKMTFDIDPKDPILGQLFHKAPNGELICDARYVEVGAEMGSKNGIKEFVMCATEEGKGVHSINTVTSPKIDDFIQANVKTDIVMPTQAPNMPDVYMPPIIPLLPRTPLEPTEGKKPIISPYYGYGGFGRNKEEIERWDKNKSANLDKDPKAKLNQEEEVQLYFDKQKENPEFGEDYLKKLDDRVESSKLNSILTKETKVVVCIAVHGVSESENIYKTLQLYSKQGGDALKKSAFVLNINWREFENKSESIKKTIAEVERARKDFPQLKIAFFTQEIPAELMLRKNNRIHSFFMKNLNDTALRGIQKNNLKDDIYLISNDADCRGMSSKYLEEVIKTTESEPEKDGFLGKIEWGTEEYKKYPGYHVSMRVMQYLDAVRRNRKLAKERYVTSSGANFICKTSTFAAVGGYEPYIGAGADVDLGRKIQYARLAKTSDSESYPISYVNSAWLDTDPQRGLGNYLQGLPLAMMWQDFDKSGYKPRTELAIPAGSEESLEKFDDVVSRIEFQMNSFIKMWQYEEYAYIKALNYLLPPQKGKPAWVNKGDSKNPNITLTNFGKTWLKKQIEDYASDNKADIKYEEGRGFRS
jgi:hypothetical protein